MGSNTPAHSEGHSTAHASDPSTMVHSANPYPPQMAQDLPLYVVNPGPGGFPEPPVHVTLPTPARTTTRQKSPPTPQSQSPLTPEGQRINLQIESFFGPQPQLPPPVDLEKQEEPRHVFEHEKEPETVAKYLFYYGFICPPFWLFGTLMLFVAPRPSPDSRPTSDDVGTAGNLRPSMPSRDVMGRLRSLHEQTTERRWSLRCLYAWIVLMVCVVGLVIGLWAGRVGSFANR